jgi:predicted nucleotidyltransferase
MTSEIPAADKLLAYREGLRRRLSRPLTADEETVLDGAWREAKRAAQQLAQLHGAKRVILFGSVARRGQLRSDWDIDLAVEGMPKATYYKVVGDLHTSDGRRIDLVRLEDVRDSFRRVIALEGVLLAHGGNRRA